jgi:hypothetical protein
MHGLEAGADLELLDEVGSPQPETSYAMGLATPPELGALAEPCRAEAPQPPK